jgi:hypothetical protein
MLQKARLDAPAVLHHVIAESYLVSKNVSEPAKNELVNSPSSFDTIHIAYDANHRQRKEKAVWFLSVILRTEKKSQVLFK